MATDNKQAAKSGTTFNIKRISGKTPEGKAIWELVGRAFVRSDGTGGVLYVGQGEAQREYALFPTIRKAAAAKAPEPQPQAAEL